MNETTKTELLKLALEITKLTIKRNANVAAKNKDSFETTFTECVELVISRYSHLEDVQNQSHP